MKNRILLILTGIALSLAFTLGLARIPAPYETMEGKVFDLFFRLRGERKDTGQICIVAVDEASTQSQGDWPWPRDRIARLVEKVCAQNPALIVFDITFSRTEATPEEFTATDSLAHVAERCGNILFPYYFSREEQENLVHIQNLDSSLQQTAFASFQHPQNRSLRLIQAKSLILSSEKLTLEGRMGGHLSKIVETDKSCRREALVLYQEPFFLASMALVAAARSRHIPLKTIHASVDSGIRLGPWHIPLDEDGCALLNYYGKPGVFPRVSAGDLLEDRPGAESLKGKIVLIGLTAPGLSDIYNTPFAARFTTVEKLATALDNIFSSSWLSRKAENAAYELIVVFFAGLLGTLLGTFTGPGVFALGCAGISATALGISFAAFSLRLVWLKLASVALVPWLVFAVFLFLQKKVFRPKS